MKYLYKIGPFNYRARKRFLPALLIIDLLGYLLMWPWLGWRRKELASKEVKRILVLRLEHLGDVLLSTPVFRNLKKKFPKAKLTVIVRPFGKIMLKDNPDVDEVITFNPNWLNVAGEKGSWRNTWRLVKKLRRMKFDVGIDLFDHPMNILLLFLTSRYSISYGTLGLGFLLSKKAQFDQKVKHVIERHLDLLKPLGIKPDSLDLDLKITDKDKKNVAAKLKAKGVSAEDKFICIHPGARVAVRCWEEKKFAQLIKKLADRSAFKIVLCGGDSDLEKVKKIIAKIPDNKAVLRKVVDLSGQLSIQELAEVFRRAKVVICLNSLACHLGALAKTPLVQIFSGEGDPLEFGYPEGRNVIIQKKLDCYLCRDIHCRDNQCMKRISVEEVFKAI